MKEVQKLTRSQMKARLDADILETIINRNDLGYREIAVMFEASPRYVNLLALANGIKRSHGRKSSAKNSQLTLPEVK